MKCVVDSCSRIKVYTRPWPMVAEVADARGMSPTQLEAVLRAASLLEEASNLIDATAESTTVNVVEVGTSVVYAAATTAAEMIETATLEYGEGGDEDDDEEHLYTYATAEDPDADADADADAVGDGDEDDDTDTRVEQAGEEVDAKEEYATEGYVTGKELESEDGNDGYVTGDSSTDDIT